MASSLAGTPLEYGFRMPAEWERHRRCWMAWPGRGEGWHDLEATRRAYAAVATAIRGAEPLTVVASPGEGAGASTMLGSGIRVVERAIDHAWMRDTGPVFLTDGRGGRLACLFRFNAWGGKHSPCGNDARLGAWVAAREDVPAYRSELTLEGGAINVDGKGTVLVTEQCVLNANRNPGLGKADAERELRHALGVDKVIWLPGDPDDVETDGHVDGLACFVRPGVVMIASTPDRGSRRHAILGENRRALERCTDAAGRVLEIVEIEEAVEAEATTDIFCRAYVNFYVANGAVIMPAYGISADESSRRTVQRCFPDRRVVAVDVRAVCEGGGGIHCITQQQPG